MDKNKVGLILTALFLLALAAIASQVVDLGQTLQVLSKANIYLILLALVFETISLLLKTFKWQVLLREIDGKLNFRELFRIQLAGTAISNLTPARIGETTKALYLEKKGLKKRFTLLTILWERLFDLIAIVAFSALIVSSYGSLAGLLLFIAASLVILTHNVNKIIAGLSKFKPFAFLSTITLHKFPKRVLLKSLVIALFAWLFDFLAAATAFYSVGVNLPLSQIIGALSISTVVGILSTIPGGLGSGEAALYLLLKGTYPIATLAAAFIAARIVTIGWIFALGAISLMSLHGKIKT